MNYDNNLNPNDTISSLDKGMTSGGGVGKQENPAAAEAVYSCDGGSTPYFSGGGIGDLCVVYL